MDQNTKLKIAEKLGSFCLRYAKKGGDKGINAGAIAIGTSSATVSNILSKDSKKWDTISPEMWQSIASRIKYSVDEWCWVDTQTSIDITEELTDAKEDSSNVVIISSSGSGKTATARRFVETNPHEKVFLVECCEYWSKRDFLLAILKTMGISSVKTQSGLVEEIVECLESYPKPLLIFDEADKLRDSILYFYITLYNRLEFACGMVMMGTQFLEQRLQRGKNRDKMGFAEIMSRGGGGFHNIQKPKQTDGKKIEYDISALHDDIRAICRKNGLEDSKVIETIVQASSGDLRRVRTLVRAELKVIKLLAKSKKVA